MVVPSLRIARAAPLFLSCLTLAAAVTPPVHATWFYSANSVFQSKADVVDHPPVLTQMVVLPNDAVRPVVCVAYGNSLGKGNTGRVTTSVRITTPETTDMFGLPVAPVVREMALSGSVAGNELLACAVAPDMFAGDIVEFDHSFEKMPKIRASKGKLEYVAVSGVVSDAGEPTLWAEVNGLRLPEGNSPRGVLPGNKDGWHHSAHTIYQAEAAEEPHPKSAVAALVVPDSAKRPKLCAGYSNMAGNPGKGKLEATIKVSRADGEVETVRMTKGVKKNKALKCRATGALEAGDFVDFDFRFKGMPKLGRYERTVEFASATGVVSTSGEPAFRAELPPAPEPYPDPGPPNVPPPATSPAPAPSSPSPGPSTPPPGDSGGPLSSADYAAAAKLLKNATKTQLWRPKGDNPAKWVVVGPKTVAISGNKLNYSTAGVGGTIAAAVADYERKMGSLGVEGTLSGGEQAGLRWYSGINSAGGPTSIRRDGGGSYHGEYYRPSSGAQHHGPLSSLQAAIDYLISRGL